MAQYITYDMVGIKEDISDVISNITPTKVPFQTMIGSETVKNTLFQWQEDDLRAVAVNAKVEGFTAVDSTREPTTMRSNYTQILSDTIKVSGTADTVDTYGRAKESAYQMAKVASELKRDLEHAYVGIENAAVAGNSSTAREMASFFNMVDSTMFTYTGATSTKPDEADVLAALQDTYNEGADPNTLMVTPTNSLEIADFAFKNRAGTSLARSRDVPANKIVNVVDVYTCPFGKVDVVLNRFLMDKRTLVFDPEMWKKVTLRPWFRETLAKSGDNTTIMLTGEFSLKHKNFKASAVIEEDAS